MQAKFSCSSCTNGTNCSRMQTPISVLSMKWLPINLGSVPVICALSSARMEKANAVLASIPIYSLRMSSQIVMISFWIQTGVCLALPAQEAKCSWRWVSPVSTRKSTTSSKSSLPDCFVTIGKACIAQQMMRETIGNSLSCVLSICSSSALFSSCTSSC